MRLAFLLFALAFSAKGQQEPEWRMASGDDPRWASPDFDDSSWTPDRGLVGSTAIAMSTAQWPAGVHWYRTAIDLAPEWRGKALGIEVGPLQDAYAVYAEGILVGQFGAWEPKPVILVQRHKFFAIPAALTRGDRLHIAIRRYCGPHYWNWFIHRVPGTGLFPHLPVIGLEQAMRQQAELHLLRGFASSAVMLVLYCLNVQCGLFCLALYFNQRDHKEYLWLGIALVVYLVWFAGIPMGYSETMDVNHPLSWLAVFLSLVTGRFFRLWFLSELVPRFRSAIRVAALVITLPTVISMTANYFGYGYGSGSRLTTLTDPVVMLIALLCTILCWRERRAEDAVLALVLTIAGVVTMMARRGLGEIWLSGVVLVDLRIAASTMIAITMMWVLWLRFQREQQRHAVIESDLKAAREMQELFLRSTAEATPGFTLETAYHPALEVGGDFYHVVPDEDGSLLVVAGDVSGKGMKAAMLVAGVVGSLRSQSSRSPAGVLASLNNSLCGNTGGGFVTCCAVLFEKSGKVTMANAGNPAPYCDGHEVLVDAGLPLGIAPGVEYPECVTQGAMFTFVSDGVVEAENAQRELFGFDRTREISGKSAQEIAEAAQAWGQNDDITVVTVRRNG